MTTNIKNSNTAFSKLKGNDLKDLFNFLKSYYLTLRNNIGINKNDTFGLEIEFEDCPLDKALELFEKYMQGEWILKNDGSIRNGGEINTPIMNDNTLFWYELDDLCRMINLYATPGEHTAGHIHIGGQIFESGESILKFLKVWSAYEDIIFRFSYGEYECYRPIISIYSKPCALKFKNLYDKLEYSKCSDIINDLYLGGGRSAVNFKIRTIDKLWNDNTIEFRCPNGTLESVIWQNNVNLFIKLIYACNSSNIDMDLVDFRIKQNTSGYLLETGMLLNRYTLINHEKALEFCDLIFNNYLDKIYFLRQYYKNFENVFSFQKSKKFVK